MNQPKDSMAPKNITVTSKTVRTGTSNSLNVRSTINSSHDANIKIKTVVEIKAKVTPLPQQFAVASPILVESTGKSASQKRSPASTTNTYNVMSVMMTRTTLAEELHALKLQLEALNNVL
ncbi:hypothetical protein JCGZ_12736 [Jatropha curcas]|uniref:Uncharacterized protein n=1 Tax=Jatropha curcas TaxID=180498 RepID=A0A067KN63_JATCU|nr:hypothetical protein JCGZ_12736 [Jatropha curcas]